MKVYQATALFSVMLALVGFSYNVWRLQANEHNSTVRTASFEMFQQLAELEQLVFAAHYDGDVQAGNPRVGWVKVGLINDLSMSCGGEVPGVAAQLRETWAASWPSLPQNRDAAEAVISAIDATRASVHQALENLD